MTKSDWNELFVGDFFIARGEEFGAPRLYQKVFSVQNQPYNAVLVNTGQLCCIHESNFKFFESVNVAFEIKPKNNKITQ